MLRFADRMIRRLGLACALLLALAFATPAFATHVCAESETCAPSAPAMADASSDNDPACPDCGPACANGCCHAPHAATAPEPIGAPTPGVVARTQAWRHAMAPPPVAPAGPDRPPRA
ncbi:MAG: hypothetical protein V4701_05585 [Pseudomonadota bacterium]